MSDHIETSCTVANCPSCQQIEDVIFSAPVQPTLSPLMRYTIRRDLGHGFIEDPQGQFVRYDDVASTLMQQAQEVERTQKELNHHVRQRCYAIEENITLKREIERLTLANEMLKGCLAEDGGRLAVMTTERNSAIESFNDAIERETARHHELATAEIRIRQLEAVLDSAHSAIYGKA